MATSRKLQLEIDRCLKKVYEGIDLFNTIWERMHDPTMNTFETQKKKDGIELRKEIKRLRRLREQIRNWIASEDIKNKSTLIEARKSIETQMERFEANERKAKIKTFSTDGLNRETMTTEERERNDINDWLATSIDSLHVQMDQFDCEVESLLLIKKKPSKDTMAKIEELKTYQERHSFHIKKLETLLRLFNNMSIGVEQIQSIKEDVDYYIESLQESGLEDNMYIYDGITGLEDTVFCAVDVLFPPRSDDDSSDGSVNISCASVSSQRDVRQNEWTKTVSKKRLKTTQSTSISTRNFRDKPPATCTSNPTNSRSKHWSHSDHKNNKITNPTSTNNKTKPKISTNFPNAEDEKKNVFANEQFPSLSNKPNNTSNKSWSSVLSSYKQEECYSPGSNSKSWSAVLTKSAPDVTDNAISDKMLNVGEEPINLYDRLSVFIAWFFKDYFKVKQSSKTPTSSTTDEGVQLWNKLPPVDISYFSTSPSPASPACSWQASVEGATTAAILQWQLDHLMSAYTHLPEVNDSCPGNNKPRKALRNQLYDWKF